MQSAICLFPSQDRPSEQKLNFVSFNHYKNYYGDAIMGQSSINLVYQMSITKMRMLHCVNTRGKIVMREAHSYTCHGDLRMFG
ncbi:hypothetical protein EUGRSUZ_F04335 [Eucalyptus grandis]|uniref:Uncharacterized protein n=2 Tax=Eucalyptus grandis TaxID=71139 RepID=A0ACC3KQE4_EUCGR|nr:hypothetical protein EUGRSUZ_F04335 [Eucalyptus grandis]